MKNKKSRFLRSVRRLAPNDNLLFRAAMRVPEHDLPCVTGAAAVNFVVAFYHLTRQVPALPGPAGSRPSAQV